METVALLPYALIAAERNEPRIAPSACERAGAKLHLFPFGLPRHGCGRCFFDARYNFTARSVMGLMGRMIEGTGTFALFVRSDLGFCGIAMLARYFL